MKNPVIYTFSGKIVNPLDVREEDIVIEDIAHALACCNRFAGHVKRPISVAQHSVWTSWICDGPNALQALLHDASEAYLGDVTKWLKSSPEFAAYRVAEERVQQAIYSRFGCAEKDSEEVQAADKLLVRFEMMRGFDHRVTVGALNKERDRDYPPLTENELVKLHVWDFWTWQQSEEIFLNRFNLLYHGIHSDPCPSV